MFFNLYKTVYALRTKAGLSVSDISQITGISVRSIYRYERGEVVPSLEYMVYLSKTCAVSIDEMLGMTN